MKLIPALALISLVAAGCTSTADAAEPVWDDCSNGYVTLTFDDGPAATTARVLDTLDEENISAMFFIEGRQVETNQVLVQEIVLRGHQIGNHSWDNVDLTELDEETLRAEHIGKTQEVIFKVTGIQTPLFRAPMGYTNSTVEKVVEDLGMVQVGLGLDTNDWREEITTEDIIDVVDTARDGDTILLHSRYNWDDTKTLDAIPQIADSLRENGLCPGPMSVATGTAVAPEPEPEPTREP